MMNGVPSGAPALCNFFSVYNEIGTKKFYSLSHALYIVYFATKKNMVIKLSYETLAIQ